MSQFFREYHHKLLFISFLLLSFTIKGQDKDIEGVKKQAQVLFDDGEYMQAKDLYSQLVSLYPKDENYNYKFGACMLFVDPDKTFPIKFLEYAVSRPNVEVEAFYFLAKGYHYNYRFDEAINYFNKYLAKLDVKDKGKYPAKQDIRHCENGKSLMKNISSPHVVSKKKVNKSDFFISFKLKGMGGRVLLAPKELQSSVDKKKEYSPVMYKNDNSNIVYYTSYGNTDKNGIDIYKVYVSNMGVFGKPIRLSDQVNTPYDEGFPFLGADKSSFYFSSVGHNSMGGYDIFKCSYDSVTDTFGSPINLDYSINTPDDDFMYADAGDGISYFSSNRNSAKGKVYVYTINSSVENKPLAVLSGIFDSEDTRQCKITVEDLNDHIIVGSFNTDKKTGNYVMRLTNGGSYSFLVEPFGRDVAYKGRVDLPKQTELKLLKQEIEIQKEDGVEKLIIRNLFEQDSQEGDVEIVATLLAVEADLEESKEPEITISEEEMISEIEKNQKEIEEHIGVLKVESATSYAYANKKRELAQMDLEMAERLDSQISLNDNSSDNRKKQEELSQLMTDAKTHSKEAEYAFELGKEIEKQSIKSQEDLNKTEAFIAELKAAQTAGNKEKSIEIFTSFTNGNQVDKFVPVEAEIAKLASLEEQKMERFVKKANEIAEEQVSLENEIKSAKAEYKATKKKKEKESIQLRIDDLSVLLEPLDEEKEAAYEMARTHEKNAVEFNNQLATIEAVKSEVNTDLPPETASEEQKAALISSILATTSEIDALESASSEKVKLAEVNSANVSDSELVSNDTETSNAEPELNTNEAVVDETEVAEENPSTESELAAENKTIVAPIEKEEYFEYTTEYETPVDEVVLVNGKSVPLEVTTNTGKRQYKEEELKGAEVVFANSSYNTGFQEQTESNKSVENSLEKAKQNQRINYEWVTAIEKEVAELTYVKSNSDNQAYNNKLDERITVLNNQASQKRNFMALNAQIIKQISAQEESATAEAEPIAINSGLNDSSTVETQELDNELANNESTNELVSETETKSGSGVVNVDPEVVAVIDADSAVENQIEPELVEETEPVIENGISEEVVATESVKEIEDETGVELVEESKPVEEIENEGLAEVQQNSEDVEVSSQEEVLNASLSPEVSEEKETPSVLTVSPSVAVIEEIEQEKEVQRAVVVNKEVEKNGLEKELEVTRKKKKKREIEAQLAVVEASVQYEKRKLRLIDQKKNSVESAQDSMIANPLSSRPSEQKFAEAKKYRSESANLEMELEELNAQLEQTKRKKHKRVVAAEIQNVEANLAMAKLNSELTLESANEMKEVEVETLKKMTKYGSEELVKLPVIPQALTASEITEVEQLESYGDYIASHKEYEKHIESADVLYQQGEKKTQEVSKMEEEISLLNQGMELLPLNEQDSLRILVVEKKAKQKKLIAEAEVFYQEAKQETNEGYYKLNEANSSLLALNNSEERTKVIAALSGNVKVPEVVFDSSDVDAIPTNLASDIFINTDSVHYSDSKPIPVGVSLPKGVILKVQIGAFRLPIKQETFKGFAPIVGEKTSSGLTRYTAGLFTNFETANGAKDNIRAKGYSDAFVVAYLNGDRISISDARKLLAGEIAISDFEKANPSEPVAQNTRANDIKVPVNTVNSTQVSPGSNVQVGTVESRGNLFFTVQVGVYSQNIDPSTVLSLTPLNKQNIPNNLVRFSSGVYGSVNEAINARNRIVQNGITDAFVTAYYNGDRVTIAEAKRIGTEGNSAGVQQQQQQQQQQQNTNTTPKPTNSATIGVKNDTSNSSTTYYIAVGPYQGAIPVEQARTILGMSSLGVVVDKNNGATLYKIGNFATQEEAKALQQDLILKGLINPLVVEGENK